jgi:hypothetical protein
VATILVNERPCGIGGDPPRFGHPAELAEGHRARSLDERGFGSRERLWSSLLGGCEHMDGRFGDLTFPERAGHLGHRFERTSATDAALGCRARQPLPLRQPRRRRQVAVDRVDLSTSELRQAATALELEDASRALDLIQVTGERLVRQ